MLSNALLLLLGLLSLSVWAVIIGRWSRGAPALEALPRNRSPWLPVACSAAGLYVVMMLATSLAATLTSPEATPEVQLSNVKVAVANGSMEIIVALALLTGAGLIPLRECGIHQNQPTRQLWDGILGFLASLAPVALVLLATFPLRTPENQHPFLKLLQENQAADTIAWLLLSAVVIAPIKEELLFRVMLQDGLARRIGSAPAIGIVSVLFCAVHGFPDSLALLPLAVVLGYVYDRRQSVLSVVLVHALFNLANIGILLFTGDELM